MRNGRKVIVQAKRGKWIKWKMPQIVVIIGARVAGLLKVVMQATC